MTQDKHDIGHQDCGQSIDEVKAHWTPDRMKAAVPITPPAGRAPAQRPSAPAAEPRPLEPARPPRVDRAVGEPAPYTAAKVAQPREFPYRTVGKLFFTIAGQDATASASVVYDNTILCAAHSLFDVPTRSWSTNLLFVPAYEDGAPPPFGLWTGATSHTMPGWAETGDRTYDVGLVTMTPKGLADKVGMLGFIVSLGWNNIAFQALGYPGQPSPPYDGNTLWSSTGTSIGLSPDGAIAVGMPSNFRHGSSGGPWLVDGSNFVNGLTGGGVPNQPDVIYSPYFDNNVRDFFLKVRS